MRMKNEYDVANSRGKRVEQIAAGDRVVIVVLADVNVQQER